MENERETKVKRGKGRKKPSESGRKAARERVNERELFILLPAVRIGQYVPSL